MTSRPFNLADIIEQMADSVGSRPAVITETHEFAYADIDERTTRLANYLVSAGIRPGDRLAVHAMNCIEWVDAFYGTMKARAVPINVNYRYRQNELRHICGNSESVMTIIAPEYVDLVNDIRPALPHLGQLLVLGEDYDAALARRWRTPRRRDLSPSCMASSGSGVLPISEEVRPRPPAYILGARLRLSGIPD